MTLVCDPDDPHAADQLLRFAEHVKTLKHIAPVDAGREAAVNTFTVDSPIRYRLEHLLAKLEHAIRTGAEAMRTQLREGH